MSGYNPSKAQLVVLAMVPKVTSTLSCFGSGWIVLEVLGDKEKRKSVYHRLMLVFSFNDFWVSFAFFFSTWAVPDDTENVLWAVGNEFTCNLQGFLIQMGSGSFVYSATLTLYFVMVIRLQMKEREIKKQEWWLHGLPLSFAFGTSITCLVTNVYGNSNLWCWIIGAPGLGALFRWILYYVELWVCFIVILVGMGLIIRGVQVTERESAKHDAAAKARMGMLTTTSAAMQSQSETDDGGQTSREQRKKEKELKEKMRLERIKQTKRTRQVATQALLYVLTFYMTFFFPTVNRAYQALTGKSKYGLLLMHETTVPLQGFFNFLIYRRHDFRKLREQYPDASWWEIIKEGLIVSLWKDPNQRRPLSSRAALRRRTTDRNASSRDTISRNSATNSPEESAPISMRGQEHSKFNGSSGSMGSMVDISEEIPGDEDVKTPSAAALPAPTPAPPDGGGGGGTTMIANRISMTGEVYTIGENKQGSAPSGGEVVSRSTPMSTENNKFLSEVPVPSTPTGGTVVSYRESSFSTNTGQTMSHEYYCPITRKLFKDPVVAPDGRSYERNAIQATGRYSKEQLYPNTALQAIIWEHLIDMSGVDKSIQEMGEEASTNESSLLDSGVMFESTESRVVAKQAVPSTPTGETVVSSPVAMIGQGKSIAEEEETLMPKLIANKNQVSKLEGGAIVADGEDAVIAKEGDTSTPDCLAIAAGPVAMTEEVRSIAELKEASTPNSDDAAADVACEADHAVATSGGGSSSNVGTIVASIASTGEDTLQLLGKIQAIIRERRIAMSEENIDIANNEEASSSPDGGAVVANGEDNSIAEEKEGGMIVTNSISMNGEANPVEAASTPSVGMKGFNRITTTGESSYAAEEKDHSTPDRGMSSRISMTGDVVASPLVDEWN